MISTILYIIDKNQSWNLVFPIKYFDKGFFLFIGMKLILNVHMWNAWLGNYWIIAGKKIVYQLQTSIDVWEIIYKLFLMIKLNSLISFTQVLSSISLNLTAILILVSSFTWNSFYPHNIPSRALSSPCDMWACEPCVLHVVWHLKWSRGDVIVTHVTQVCDVRQYNNIFTA